MSASLERIGAAAVGVCAALALSACGDGASDPSSTAVKVSSPAATSSTAATTSSSAASATPVLPTATESLSPSASPTTQAKVRVKSSDGSLSVEMPVGWTQNPTSDDTYPSITLNAPDGGNLQILSLRGAQPARSVTEEYARQLKAVGDAFPSCTFASDPDVVDESLGGKVDATYRVYTCDDMPFSFAVFTANGPNGELLAGHEADFAKKSDNWKAVVKSVMTSS